MTNPQNDPQSVLVVGLMSGTSLDGIASAVVRFTESDSRIDAELVGFSNRAYTRDERERLARALSATNVTMRRVDR